MLPKINKKADLTITILVIGVVAVCFLTIFSFVKSNNEISEEFIGIGLIETINSIEEEMNLGGFERSYDGVGTFQIREVRGGEKIVRIEITGSEIVGTYETEGKVMAKIIKPR